MSNLSDKEIDRLSREAADSYEPDESSLTWSRLEQKLIQEMPERPPDGFRFGRINPYVWGPAIVLIAGVSFFFIKNIIYSQHSTRTAQTVTQSMPSSAAGEKPANGNTIQTDSISSAKDITATENKKTTLPEQPAGQGLSADAHAKTNSSPGSSDKTNSAAALKNQKSASSGSSGETTATAVLTKPNSLSGGLTNKATPIVGQNTNPVSNSTAVNKNSGRKVSGSEAFIPASMAADNSSTHSNGKDVSKTDVANDSYISDGLNGTTGSEGNSGVRREGAGVGLPMLAFSGAGLSKITGNDSLLKQHTAINVPVPYKSLRLNRSLNVGFAFGPDYTDAGGITNDQIGNNIGVTVGYYLTNKLSVNTGIFYSNKFFWSPGHGSASPQVSSFIANGYARTNAAAPPVQYVNGSTNLYELPLTLRYDFAKNDKTKFFVNGGLSSYFILKQTYINFFNSLGRAPANKIVDQEQINYWFGVADLSFGLETEIGKGFSFQAEPFFRLPLKNMGLENLKLNSYGFMLSFRYTPVLSRKKK
jgi:hypothetical protein